MPEDDNITALSNKDMEIINPQGRKGVVTVGTQQFRLYLSPLQVTPDLKRTDLKRTVTPEEDSSRVETVVFL